METERFDALTRQLDAMQPRRITLGRGLVALSALGFATSTATVEARKKRKRKRCKKPPQPTCAQACDDGCRLCVTRAAGPLLCAEDDTPACGPPCSSDNDCIGVAEQGVAMPYCVRRIEDRETDQTFAPCDSSVPRCIGLSPCAP